MNASKLNPANTLKAVRQVRTTMHACTIPTTLGDMWLAATELGLAGAWFTDQRHLPDEAERAGWLWTDASAHPVLLEAKRQLDAYFSAGSPSGDAPQLAAHKRFTNFDIPLDLTRGTPFQQEVWKRLLAIDHGSTRTYGDLADSMGKPGGARAVGLAVGRNPVSIIVPCHRVLGSDGTLTGYAGGLERKCHLLQQEGVLI